MAGVATIRALWPRWARPSRVCRAGEHHRVRDTAMFEKRTDDDSWDRAHWQLMVARCDREGRGFPGIAAAGAGRREIRCDVGVNTAS